MITPVRSGESASSLRTSRPGAISALVALTVVFVAEMVRLYPAIVTLTSGSTGTHTAALLVAPVVGVALALVFAVRRDARTALVVCGIVLVTARLGAQLSGGGGRLALVGLGLAAGLAVLAILASMGLPLFGGGVLGGVLLDAAMHTAAGTRSLIWIESGWAVVAVVAIVGWYLYLLADRARRDVFLLGRTWRASMPLVLIGPVLVIEAFMLANLGWTGDMLGLGWFASALAIASAGAAGVIAAAWTARVPEGPWVWSSVVGAIALVALSSGSIQGPWWFVAMVLAQVGIGAALTSGVARGVGTGHRCSPGSALIIGYLVLVGAVSVLDGRGLFGLALSPNSVLVLVSVLLAAAAIRSRSELAPRPHRPGRAELMSLIGVFVVPGALVVAGVPSLGALGRAAPVDIDEMRVVTYNVALAFDEDGHLNLTRITESLAAVDADVVALQEVPRGHLPAGGVDMLGWLQHALEMPYVVFQPSAPGALHGNAVLSRYPFSSVTSRQFERTGTALPRGALAVDITPPGHERVTVIAAHLPPGGTLGERAERVGAIIDLRAGRDRTIVAADLNSQPGSDILTSLGRSGLVSAWDPETGAGYTFPARAPRARIDWVLHTPDLDVAEATVHRLAGSDHLPVSATVRLS